MVIQNIFTTILSSLLVVKRKHTSVVTEFNKKDLFSRKWKVLLFFWELLLLLLRIQRTSIFIRMYIKCHLSETCTVKSVCFIMRVSDNLNLIGLDIFFYMATSTLDIAWYMAIFTICYFLANITTQVLVKTEGKILSGMTSLITVEVRL